MPTAAPWDGKATLARPGRKYGPCYGTDAPEETPPSCSDVQVTTNAASNAGGGKLKNTVQIKFLSDHAAARYLYVHTSYDDFTATVSYIRNHYINILHPVISFSSQLNGFSAQEEGHRTSEIILKKTASTTVNEVNSVEFEYTPVTTLDFCIYDVKCSDVHDFMDEKSTNLTNFDPAVPLEYDTVVEYHCGEGRGFIQDDGTSTNEVQQFECNWDEKWTPLTALRTCKCKMSSTPKQIPNKTFLTLLVTHCLTPPEPLPEYNLETYELAQVPVPIDDVRVQRFVCTIKASAVKKVFHFPAGAVCMSRRS